MPSVSFTRALGRHVDCPTEHVGGASVGEALHAYFDVHPAVRHYVLDDQGGVRKHVAVFVAGRQIRDRRAMSDEVTDGDEIHVMQALSGG